MATRRSKKLTRPERNALENEVVFRRANEKIAKGLEKLEIMAIKNHYNGLIGDDLELQFLCECSDENCTERIRMKAKKYLKLHENRKQFIVKPGHQAVNIESVAGKKQTYTLVKKFNLPSESPTVLKMTSIDNS